MRALALLAASFGLVTACVNHDHSRDHAPAKRSTGSSNSAIASPTVPLVWGDVNFIHTTDSHGWLLGHQKDVSPEPNYSGDLGSFASFVQHMKAQALARNVDLLLVDSGDLHDGTGLTDGFPPGGVDAHDANQFIAKLPYDIMAIGNHELYIYANTLDMHVNFAPQLKGRYLSSNVNITVADKKGNPVSVPVGDRFAKFKTRLGRKVTALGVLYDFTDNDHNTTVQFVKDMVKESWFLNAIQDEPDFFLLVGHMPVQRDNWPLVFNAIRAVHPTTPIFIFGGHTHIRDCVQLDANSMSLESGRYLETVGWMSVKFGKGKDKGKLSFTRRYLDPNPVTYAFHTGLKGPLSITPLGAFVKSGLQAISKRFSLNFQFGTAPQSYFVSRAAFPGNDSLLSLVADQVMPIALKVNNSRASTPAMFITNSGSLRFDLFQGPFTRDDQFIASPFDDTFLFLPDVPISAAKQVLPIINKSGQDTKRRKRNVRRRTATTADDRERRRRGLVEERFDEWRREMWVRWVQSTTNLEARATEATNLTLGYVTKDSCPGVGDDVLHSPLPFFSTPDFIASPVPDLPDDATIDLVFVDFIESDILTITTQLLNRTITESDIQTYTPISANEMIGVFAQQAWN